MCASVQQWKLAPIGQLGVEAGKILMNSKYISMHKCFIILIYIIVIAKMYFSDPINKKNPCIQIKHNFCKKKTCNSLYKKYSILFYRINNIIFISLLLIVQCNKEHNLDIINNNQACFYCLYKYNTGIIRICVMRRQIGREKEPMHILLRLFPSILFTEYNSIAFTPNSRVIHHLFLWNTNTNRFLI